MELSPGMSECVKRRGFLSRKCDDERKMFRRTRVFERCRCWVVMRPRSNFHFQEHSFVVVESISLRSNIKSEQCHMLVHF